MSLIERHEVLYAITKAITKERKQNARDTTKRLGYDHYLLSWHDTDKTHSSHSKLNYNEITATYLV